MHYRRIVVEQEKAFSHIDDVNQWLDELETVCMKYDALPGAQRMSNDEGEAERSYFLEVLQQYNSLGSCTIRNVVTRTGVRTEIDSSMFGPPADIVDALKAKYATPTILEKKIHIAGGLVQDD